MTDVKFEGEIHVHKDGLVAKFDRVNDITEEHDHSCRPFKTHEAAETYLLDKGVDLEDIKTVNHTTPEHQAEGMNMLAEALGDAAKHMTHSLDAMTRIMSLVPDSPYNFQDMQQFEDDAVTALVILSKYGLPITPEDLEAKVSELVNAKG